MGDNMSFIDWLGAIMNHKEISELLVGVPTELLLPVESVVTITIVDMYKQLRTVPIGELNTLIDTERASRGLPVIPWKERSEQTFLADLAELNKRANSNVH